MNAPVMLIPEIMIGDAEAAHQAMIRNACRRAAARRERERRQYALSAPTYFWRVHRRR